MLSEQHPKKSIVYITLYIQKTPISNTKLFYWILIFRLLFQ